MEYKNEIAKSVLYNLITIALKQEFCRQSIVLQVAMSIGTLTTTMEYLKNAFEDNKTLYDDIFPEQLVFQINGLMIYLKRLEDYYYNMEIVQFHVCKMYDLIGRIYENFKIAKEDHDYLKTTWNLYHAYWKYQYRVDIVQLKKDIKFLFDTKSDLINYLPSLSK